MTYALKVDANQPEIVRVLRGSGCTVQHIHMVGRGCPDLIVYSPFLQRMILMELKDGTLPPSKRGLTKAERRWHEDWPADVFIVHSVEEALRVVGAL